MQSAHTPGGPVNAPTPPGEITGVEVPAGTLAVEQFRSRTGERVRLGAEALVADAADIFFGPSKWLQLGVPTRLLTAEWSVGAGSAPAYTAEAVQAFRAGSLTC